MQSVRSNRSQAGEGLPVADGLTENNRLQLEEILRVSREWLAQAALDPAQRESLIRLGVLADYMINTGDVSPAAMKTALTLMCACCLGLEATQGQCLGRPQDRCLLLNGANP